MTGRMIVCKIVDLPNRTESLYHGIRLSPDSSDNRASAPTLLAGPRSGAVISLERWSWKNWEQDGSKKLPNNVLYHEGVDGKDVQDQQLKSEGVIGRSRAQPSPWAAGFFNLFSINLLVYAASEYSPINNEHGARRVTGRIGGKVDGGSSEFFDLAEALHGCAHEPFIASRGTVEQLFVQSGAKDAGCDGIHANAVRGPFDGERLR